MESTNLELSKGEFALITNSDFILTKNIIIEKIFKLYGALSEKYKTLLNDFTDSLPVELFVNAPKIYKGERYKNLPYVMLDYPRHFSKTDVFAIRSFFWWGNFFSITLHISGKYLQAFGDAVLQSLTNNNWYISMHEDEWEHDVENDNYILVNDKSDEAVSNISSKSFLKIAKKISLDNWQQAEAFYEYCFKDLLQMICAAQLPRR